MTGRVPQPLRGAPFWRRVVAGLIDIPVVGGPVIVALGYAFSRRARRNGALGSEAIERIPEMFQRYRGPLWLASVASAVVSRNWRLPGMRVMHLRRVDSRSGGPVSIKSALVAFAAARLWDATIRRLTAGRERRATEQMRELHPLLKEIQRKYADDRETQQRELMELYKARNVSPFSSCMWQVPGSVAPLALAAWPPRRQSLYERVAGTVMIVSPPK